jgi:hypothetical protein
MSAFEAEGYVLVRPPLTPEQLDEAEQTCDRLTAAAPSSSSSSSSSSSQLPPSPSIRKEDDAGFIRLISHPWFEQVAQQVLRAERVRYIELAALNKQPAAGGGAADAGGGSGSGSSSSAWSKGCHIDLQVTASDFAATPRRDMLALWLWVDDVTPERGAMRILPRSHRTIQDHWERTLRPERRSSLPRVHGLFPRPSDSYPSYPEYIPEPDSFPYSQCEPVPVAVPRGTAQIFTQSMLHSAWHNSDTRSRKGFILSWMAADVPCGFVERRCAGLRAMFPPLRRAVARLQPGREHIIYSDAEFNHFVRGRFHRAIHAFRFDYNLPMSRLFWSRN